MRKQIKILYLLVLCLLLFFLGCKKTENIDFYKQQHQASFSLVEAKEWFRSNSSNQSARANTGLMPKKITPIWGQSLFYDDQNYYIHELPTEFDKPPGFKVHSISSKADKADIKGKTKLLILKDKTTGGMVSTLMHIISEKTSGDEIHYKSPKNNFSGYIFFTDLNGKYINGWKYNNGIIIAKGQGINTHEKNNKIIGQTTQSTLPPPPPPPPGDGCYTVITEYYTRQCWQNNLGEYECTPWMYVGAEYQTYCPTGDGGGGYQPEWANSTSTGRLCANYNFSTVGNSFTATVNNLEWTCKSPQNIEYPMKYPETCLSIPNYNINQAQASSAFNQAFNAATNQVLNELNANIITPIQVQVRLKNLTQGNLAALIPGSTWSAVGSCAGNIAVNTLSSESSYCR